MWYGIAKRIFAATLKMVLLDLMYYVLGLKFPAAAEMARLHATFNFSIFFGGISANK